MQIEEEEEEEEEEEKEPSKNTETGKIGINCLHKHEKY